MITSSSKFEGFGQKKLFIIGGVVIAVLAVLAGFFFWQYINLKNNPNAEAEETTKRLVTEVGKIYALPDEKPTVAKVQDKEKLKDQSFFKNAENGDFILLYNNAKIALLYRESEHKLMNVGPINLGDAGANTQVAAKSIVKVVNGNKTATAAAVAGLIRSKVTTVTVGEDYGDAKNKNVTKTTVIDVKGGKSDLAGQIANAIGGQVGQLPAGEPAPDADILVLAGPN